MMDNITMDRKMDSENSNGKMEVSTLENGQIIKSQDWVKFNGQMAELTKDNGMRIR